MTVDGGAYAEIVVDLPVGQPLTYRVGEAGEEARAGACCVVQVGRREVMGVCVGRSARAPVAEERIRPVKRWLGEIAPLDAHWLSFTCFAAEYYQYGWGQVAVPALPPLLREPPGPRWGASLRRVRQSGGTAAGDPPAPPAVPDANAEQRAAVEAIAAGDCFAPTLLHGVTGSGKTEVYLAAIERLLARDPLAQALLLVPEIGLTPQLQGRLHDRFRGQSIVCLHSGLPAAERSAAWLAAHEGRARIVLGTRLAVFASLPALRLLIVDEEHDTSYKAADGIRYSARDLAVKRAQMLGVPVVLGSATPALETWEQAARGRYRLLRLPRRATEAAQPQVELIDQRQHKPANGLSEPLREALEQTVARGEQALVFINRRGYAPVVSCAACGWLSACPKCAVFAAFHKTDGALHCHHCGWRSRVPRACPTCGNQNLEAVGQGTQRLEETLAAALPAARILRIDRDSTRRRGAADAALAAVHAGETDVLVGTQMIAKGHDFQRVSLVGIVNADAQLVSHDFRAPERLFATVVQVAGRAGRSGLPSRVLVQTRFPEHPLFAALRRFDYEGFARSQLAERRAAGMPPFIPQALLTAQARTLETALAFLGQARALGQTMAAAATLYDPVPMPLARLAGVFRAQMLIEAPRRGLLQAFLREWLQRLREGRSPPGSRVQWQIEVDPQEI
ncbi:MAG: primosomal protein N' [Burkholderiales bacterium]|jgi:primosomal protein N' (replication factor Y)|nr:primosomal protein N' [Burkholderiales bacterium]